MIRIAPVSEEQAGKVVTKVLVGPRLDLARPVGRYLAPLPQPLGSELMFATGRGTVMVAIELAGGVPMIRFKSCPDLDLVYRRFVELRQPFLVLDHAHADPAVAPKRGTCRVCGCTMEQACPSGCWWADETETLCRQHGG